MNQLPYSKGWKWFVPIMIHPVPTEYTFFVYLQSLIKLSYYFTWIFGAPSWKTSSAKRRAWSDSWNTDNMIFKVSIIRPLQMKLTIFSRRTQNLTWLRNYCTKKHNFTENFYLNSRRKEVVFRWSSCLISF